MILLKTFYTEGYVLWKSTEDKEEDGVVLETLGGHSGGLSRYLIKYINTF